MEVGLELRSVSVRKLFNNTKIVLGEEIRNSIGWRNKAGIMKFGI